MGSAPADAVACPDTKIATFPYKLMDSPSAGAVTSPHLTICPTSFDPKNCMGICSNRFSANLIEAVFHKLPDNSGDSAIIDCMDSVFNHKAVTDESATTLAVLGTC